MSSAILVHERFDAMWPWAADHWHTAWRQQDQTVFVRSEAPEPTLTGFLPDGTGVTRLAALGVPMSAADLDHLPNLQELACTAPDESLESACTARDIAWRRHTSEGYWGQSVAEFALALTLDGLRRIPQLHRQMLSDPTVWKYAPADGVGRPGRRGLQFGDDDRFTCGTLAGKRVRVIGAGNIGTRYARWCSQIGADVAIWDPMASDPCFHGAGARREHHLHRLVQDAEIFAPMLPLRPSTRGLVSAELIDALPKGCLVVLVTRAAICDTAALEQRVLTDELALAADVFAHEPMPGDHPLLGRDNVVHTPHNAGRTRDANIAWADDLLSRFSPREDLPGPDATASSSSDGAHETCQATPARTSS